MSNVFRSKEVYKHPPKSLHDKNEMIQVRGVYVSGEYRPPYYDENGVMITEITSEKPTIVNYTSEYSDTTATNTTGLMDFQFGSITSFQIFGTESKTTSPTNTTGLLDFQFGAVMSFSVFGKDYVDTPSTNTSGMLDFTFSPLVSFSFPHHVKSFDNSPEPCLRLASITSDQATVTNYTP